MAETTGISWTDATFNPWVGCEKVSPGCAHCYAETLVTGRMGRAGTWGAEGTRERTSDANWRKPLAWQRLAEQGLLPDGKTPADHRPRVFCASLADVFDPRPELEPWRDELFEQIIGRTPHLDWQILTKRPEEARDYLTRLYDRSDESILAGVAHASWDPLPNVWIGTSIESARYTWRADVLREIPAAVRFISAEPLLGSLYPHRVATGDVGRADRPGLVNTAGSTPAPPDVPAMTPLDLTGIDWLIVGGESGGRDARPMHPEWARELRDACLAAAADPSLDEAFALGAPDDVLAEGIAREMGASGPAFFFKQWGSWLPVGASMFEAERGGIYLGFLPDGRRVSIAEAADTDRGEILRYAGSSPTAGGKHFDGRIWAEFPESRAAVPA